MKFDISEVRFGCDGHSKGLNCAIQVHVKQRIFIVPDAGRRVGNFVTDKPNPIVAGIRLLLRHGRASPSRNGRLHPDGRCDGRKCEVGCSADRELTIGSVVKHVALIRMRLAPGVLVRTKISGFAKISRTRILCCIQVTDVNPDSVRHAVVMVARVIVGARWKRSGEGIDPGARADAALVAIQA